MDDYTKVLVAIGPDQRGIAFGLLEIVTAVRCNIEELRMHTLGGLFSVTMRLTGQERSFAELSTRAEAWSTSKGYHVRLFPDGGRVDVAGLTTFKVRVFEAPDRPGLVHSIAHILMQHHVNFRSIIGDQFSIPGSGELLYRVDFSVQMEPDRRAELKQHLDEMELDFLIEPEM